MTFRLRPEALPPAGSPEIEADASAWRDTSDAAGRPPALAAGSDASANQSTADAVGAHDGTAQRDHDIGSHAKPPPSAP